MFKFAEPTYLYLLPVLVLLGLGMWWQASRLSPKQNRLADSDLLSELTQGANLDRKRLRWLLGLGALTCWVIAMANPQFGTRTRVAEVRSTEVVIALDISTSMLADDVRPNRLSRAQAFVQDLVDKLGGEQVALLVFAGQAYLQVPLTTDYGSLKLFVRASNPSQAPTQGTNFAAAVAQARQILATDPEQPEAVRRILVMLSDGENHEPLAEELLSEAAQEGISIFTVGIGTEQGGTIPLANNGPNQVKRDAQGEVVLSKFDPAALQRLAEAGEGRYYDLNGNAQGVVGSIAKAITDAPSSLLGEEVFRESASYFQLFVVLGILLLCGAYAVGRRWTRPRQLAT